MPIVGGGLSGAATDSKDADDSLSKQLSVFSEVLSLVRRSYVEETDAEGLLAGALDGAVDALDPMAAFVPASEVDSFREVREVGASRSGISWVKDRGIAYVLAVEGNSPAEEAGLERGDVLTKIDGKSTRNMPYWAIQARLAGEPGTHLELEILRRGQSSEIDLELAQFERPVPSLSEVEGVSVLRIDRFDGETVEAVRSLLGELTEKEQTRLVVDVRGVAGGDSEAAFTVAGLFVSGSLGELEPRRGGEVKFMASETPVWSGEPVVLINGGSQGPAEIFATVLRQSSGAQLVGQRSFGLAGRQSLIPLSDGSRLMLTDAYYAGPDGEPIDQSLVPDLEVEESTRRFTEQDVPVEDLILRRGLELFDREEEAEREVA